MAVTGDLNGKELQITPSDSIMAADSIVADSLTADSQISETRMGLVFDRQEVKEPIPVSTEAGASCIYLALIVGFCVVALRIRKSPGYFKTMINDLIYTRMRTNMFDNTVRETSILVLLNMMWVACMGVLMWKGIRLIPAMTGDSFGVPNRPAEGMAICIACVAIYYLLLLLAYCLVGNVFTDAQRTVLWVKGATASMGLEAIFLFPLVMLAIAQPQWTGELLIIAAIVFAMGKCVFLIKGFRIFFTRWSSWMLFLYYLCSLEIVPLVLLYLFTLNVLCRLW